ncbi:MAG: diaminohydroxyphosphoribosylaminopyrimidine deaminase [Lysobacterales bacterium]|jgi:diaminohydroxyphosphoribosylaminopyrimidine deaminase/5-amino-6-(5-phosphoribosylamino)uracil reductase
MTHEDFMLVAIDEAKKGRGKVAPNPMVGCVIVEDGVIVARGYHEVFGGLHAERNALIALGRKPLQGSIMYVTLEPCSTEGKTDACTDRIIGAKIATLVVGAIDPNPDHRGYGLTILKTNGIEVIKGILTKECEDLNSNFNQRMNAN